MPAALAPRLLYPIPEAARLLAMSPSTLYARIRDGDIKVVRERAKLRITDAELRAYVDRLSLSV